MLVIYFISIAYFTSIIRKIKNNFWESEFF